MYCLNISRFLLFAFIFNFNLTISSVFVRMFREETSLVHRFSLQILYVLLKGLRYVGSNGILEVSLHLIHSSYRCLFLFIFIFIRSFYQYLFILHINNYSLFILIFISLFIYLFLYFFISLFIYLFIVDIIIICIIAITIFYFSSTPKFYFYVYLIYADSPLYITDLINLDSSTILLYQIDFTHFYSCLGMRSYRTKIRKNNR